MTVIFGSTIQNYVSEAKECRYNKKMQLEKGTLYTFHYLDVQSNMNLKKTAKYKTKSDVVDAYNNLRQNYNETYNEDLHNLKGIAEGKNVILLQLESMQNFVVGKSNNGKEITPWFSMEGDATCGSWDLYRHKAGFEYVETLEETLTYSISIDKLNDLYKSRIDIANWMRVLQQENFLLLQDIHISRLNLSAQERYEKLIKEYPSIFHRVTLGHIASFLGITQPSLSRIRSSR